MVIKPQPTDISDISLQGSLNNISYVGVFPTSSGSWCQITMDADESKQVILQPRLPVEWYVSTTSGGDYFTLHFGAVWYIPLVTYSGATICWAMTNYDTSFELIVGQ